MIETTNSASVLVDTLDIDTGDAASKKIGLLTLNSEKTLNSLSRSMVDRLYQTLRDWQIRPDIVCVFLCGKGQRAFCAGGDIQKLYHSAIEKPGGPCDYAEEFFRHEYRLNYLLHTYSKPLLCWGHGIVMGGGLGLLAGASHRIGTPSTRIAMPEVSIGLFPDVGGSWILNRLPHYIGYFLALTGAPVCAQDALEYGLLDYCLDENSMGSTLQSLRELPWTGQLQEDSIQIDRLLCRLTEDVKDNLLPTSSHIKTHLDKMANLFTLASNEVIPKDEVIPRPHSALGDIVSAIKALPDDRDNWMSTAQAALKAGSPLSCSLIYRQLINSRDYDLKAVFKSEFLLATNVVRFREFSEGVRALLIDKDKQPQWTYQSVADIPDTILDAFFTQPAHFRPLSL